MDLSGGGVGGSADRRADGRFAGYAGGAGQPRDKPAFRIKTFKYIFMFSSYLKIAWRNLLRNKTNSFINIGGLAIGIACVIFIVLYVQAEMSYDRGFKNAGRIYQVNLNANFGGQRFNTANTPPPVALSLLHEFPEVEAYTRIYPMGNEVVRGTAPEQAGRPFTERRSWGVDSNFLQVFDY